MKINLFQAMVLQEIVVGFIGLIAIAYLVYYVIKQTKSHDCDDCGLMKMKKESEAKNK